jgi:ABC-type multidrug transport system fused ATPase/permease subunit
LVLDRGILVENGTHEELMKLNGIYRTLYMGKEDEK